jgi:hypothetical protein
MGGIVVLSVSIRCGNILNGIMLSDMNRCYTYHEGTNAVT